MSAARQAPTAGSPGGSRASICPCEARCSWSAERRMPPSTITVRSPGSYSRIRSSPAVESRISPPSRSIDTVSPAASASAASSSVDGSETLGKTCPLQRVRAVRARHLAAEAGRREDLAGVRQSVGVEGAAQQTHRLEVALAEQLRHRACLVDPDAVLPGEGAAGVDARVEN